MLKYLFVAGFADGTVIKQEQHDRSAIEPETRSQFFDVLKKAEESKLEVFQLRSIYEMERKEICVDLTDGHFEINGVPFRVHKEQPIGDLEIIFWRQHRHTIEVTGDQQKETGHEISYQIGWKEKGNQNYQRIIEID